MSSRWVWLALTLGVVCLFACGSSSSSTGGPSTTTTGADGGDAATDGAGPGAGGGACFNAGTCGVGKSSYAESDFTQFTTT